MKPEKEIEKEIEAAISEIRPQLQADGGDIEFVGLTPENIVQVRLRGACAGCLGAVMTLKMGVERVIKERVPGIKSVENVG
jgi:Fe-S cluster biogenesis protein NfuA